MKRWEETILRRGTGLAVRGATVTVYLPGTTTKATLYSANSAILANVKGNPVTADENGLVWFYVANGSYDLLIEHGNDDPISRPDEEIYDLEDLFALFQNFQSIVSVTGPMVNSRSLVAAIASPANLQTVILTESGYAGEFLFDWSNHVTDVTNDPGQVNFIAPASASTGVGGAWVRVRTYKNRLERVSAERLPSGPIALPTLFDNKLAAEPYWDGERVAYPARPYDLIDFVKNESTGVITFTGQPSNGETITVGGQVYTFKTALTSAAGDVKIGASTSATQINLMQAIARGYGSAGTNYATATPRNPNASATQGTGTTINIALKATATAKFLAASSAATNVSVSLNINVYYKNYFLGADSGTGNASGTGAWKTATYVYAHAVSPCVVVDEDEWTGFLSWSVATKHFSGKMKWLSGSASGRTILAGMREDYTVASFAWSASGANGAYVSSALGVSAKFRAQFDGKYKDRLGIPRPVTLAASQAACEATTGRGTFFYDTGTNSLYVHMWDDRIPDPNDGWLYASASGKISVWQDLYSGGCILFENFDFICNQGTSSSAAGFLYNQNGTYAASGGPFPTTWIGDNTNKVGLKNCLSYGSSGNGMSLEDGYITVLDNCHTAYNRIDGLNYHSERVNKTTLIDNPGNLGRYITIYEADCSAWRCGFGGWYDQGALTTSCNLTTCHEAQNILRSGFRGAQCNGSAIADVNGTVTVLLDCEAGRPNEGGTASPKALHWHSIDNMGSNTDAGMYIWGGRGHDNGESGVKLFADTANGGGTAGKIMLKHWRGQTDGSFTGKIYDWDGNPL